MARPAAPSSRSEGAARQVADQLEAIKSGVDGRLIPAYAAHARALAGSDADALHQVSLDFEEMGAMVYAAEAAAEAARIHRSESRLGSALTASARAARLAEACDGLRTPALADMSHPLPLTPPLGPILGHGDSTGLPSGVDQPAFRRAGSEATLEAEP